MCRSESGTQCSVDGVFISPAEFQTGCPEATTGQTGKNRGNSPAAHLGSHSQSLTKECGEGFTEMSHT